VKDVKEGSGSNSDAGPGGSSGGGTVKAGEKPDGNRGYDTAEVRGETSKGGSLEGSGQELRGGGKAAGGGGDKIKGVSGAAGQTSRVDDIKGLGNTPRDVKSSNGRGQGNEEGGSGGGGFGTVSGIKNRREKPADEGLPSRLESIGDLVKELDLQLQGGKIDPRMLKTLQVGEDEVRDFVTRYKKSQADVARSQGRGGSAHAVVEKGTEQRAGKGDVGKGEGKVRLATDAVGRESQDALESSRARVSPEFAELLREYTIGVSKQ
jgi:hypothetical protein